MQILSKLVIVLSVMLGGLIVISPDVAFANTTTPTTCKYLVGDDGKWYPEGSKPTDANKLDDAPDACKAASDSMVGKILRFVNVLSALVIVFAVGMIIYAGFKYITSQGDPKQVESAKQQLWYSGVGLFIVLTAFTILQLFKNASGA